jgi:hypothetical protein
VPELNADVLAESLAATVRDLQAYIEVRADEIAGPLITATQQRAAERVAELERDLAMSEQRREDVIAELQRAIGYRDRHAEQQATRIAELKTEGTELRELRKRVVRELVVCATGEDGTRYAPYDLLLAALNDKGDPK